uniref:Secreted protein n=1 Tax=Toxocara canis TaxID=6265 RepID=A0A183U211_TOXCA
LEVLHYLFTAIRNVHGQHVLHKAIAMLQTPLTSDHTSVALSGPHTVHCGDRLRQTITTFPRCQPIGLMPLECPPIGPHPLSACLTMAVINSRVLYHHRTRLEARG